MKLDQCGERPLGAVRPYQKKPTRRIVSQCCLSSAAYAVISVQHGGHGQLLWTERHQTSSGTYIGVRGAYTYVKYTISPIYRLR